MKVRDGRWRTYLWFTAAVAALLTGGTFDRRVAAAAAPSARSGKADLLLTRTADGALVECRVAAGQLAANKPMRLRFRVVRATDPATPLPVAEIHVFVSRADGQASRQLAPIRESQSDTWQVTYVFPEAGEYVLTFSFARGGRRSGVSFPVTVKAGAPTTNGRNPSVGKQAERSASEQRSPSQRRRRALLDAPPMRLRPVRRTTETSGKGRQNVRKPAGSLRPAAPPPLRQSGPVSVHQLPAAPSAGLIAASPPEGATTGAHATRPRLTRPLVDHRELRPKRPAPAVSVSAPPRQPSPPAGRERVTAHIGKRRTVHAPAALAKAPPAGRFAPATVKPQMPTPSEPAQRLRSIAHPPVAPSGKKPPAAPSPRPPAVPLRSTRSMKHIRLAAVSLTQSVVLPRPHEVGRSAMRIDLPAVALRSISPAPAPGGRPVSNPQLAASAFPVPAPSPSSGAPGTVTLSAPPSHPRSAPSLTTQHARSSLGTLAAVSRRALSPPLPSKPKPSVTLAPPRAHLRSTLPLAVTAAGRVISSFPQPPPTRLALPSAPETKVSLQSPPLRRERVRPTKLVLPLAVAASATTTHAPQTRTDAGLSEVTPVVRTRPSPLVAGRRALIEITLLRVAPSPRGVMSSEPTEARSLLATFSAVGRPEQRSSVRRVAPTRRIGVYRVFRYFAAPGQYILRLTGTTIAGAPFAARVSLIVGPRGT